MSKTFPLSDHLEIQSLHCIQRDYRIKLTNIPYRIKQTPISELRIDSNIICNNSLRIEYILFVLSSKECFKYHKKLKD